MDVFAAIADPVRRSLLEQLARDGSTRVVDLTHGRGISRPAVSRHLRVLGEVGLVRAADHGRERYFELVADPLEQVQRWTGALVDPSSAPLPAPVPEHALDALDLEVRRTVRERPRRTASPQAGESA